MVKIVSFDLEGTLVTQDFSEFVWLEGIPKLYAKKEKLNFQHAKKIVLEEYEKVGENRIEWYDIKYWLNHFGLKNNYMEVFREYVDKISYYPEVFEVLESLSKNYVLVLISNSAREFLEFLTEKIKSYFRYSFSATSDFKFVKKNEKFYRKVCEILNVKPENIAHVGDRWEDDFKIPRKVGIQAFYLDRLGKINHEFVVKNLKEFEIKVRGGKMNGKTGNS